MVKEVIRQKLKAPQYYLLAATTASIPFDIETSRLFFILLSIVTFFAVDWRMAHMKVSALRIMLLPAAFGFMNLFGILWTSNLSAGLRILERNAFLVALPLIIVLLPPTKKDVRRLFELFVWVCLLICLYCIVIAAWRTYDTGSIINMDKITDREYNRFFNLELTDAADLNPIYLSLFVNMSVVYLLNKVIVEGRGQRNDLIRLIVLHGCQILIFAISGAIALCAAWALMMLLIAKRTTPGKRFLIGAAFMASVTIFGVATYFIQPLHDRLFVPITYDFTSPHVSSWTGISIRVAVWECAAQAARDAPPLLGYGTGDANDVLQYYYNKNNFSIASSLKLNAHNQFLQSYLMTGIPGLMVVVIILFGPLICSIVRGHWFMMMLCTLVILGAATEVLLDVQKGNLFLAIFFPLVYLLTDNGKAKAERIIT